MFSKNRRSLLAAPKFIPLCLLVLIAADIPADAQDLLWLRQFGANGYDFALDLAADGAGGVIVGGSTTGSLGGTHLAGWDAFVAQYNRKGDQLWIRQIGTNDDDEILALAPDGAGGAMAAGYTGGSLSGPSTGGDDAILARYDGAGSQLWIRQFGTSENDRVRALAPDGIGGDHDGVGDCAVPFPSPASSAIGGCFEEDARRFAFIRWSKFFLKWSRATFMGGPTWPQIVHGLKTTSSSFLTLV